MDPVFTAVDTGLAFAKRILLPAAIAAAVGLFLWAQQHRIQLLEADLKTAKQTIATRDETIRATRETVSARELEITALEDAVALANENGEKRAREAAAAMRKAEAEAGRNQLEIDRLRAWTAATSADACANAAQLLQEYRSRQ